MRLVRFLAAGKSLVGLKDNEGRYRLPNGHALPRFGPTGNVGAPAKAEPAHLASPEGSEAIAATSEARAGTVGTVTERGEQSPEPFPQSSQPSSVQASKTLRTEKGSIFGRLLRWLPWHRETLGTGAVPVFSNLPVQTELSLDNVKVVRNDLSESDLEVQPVQKGKLASPFSKQQVGEQSSSEAMNLSLPRSGAGPGGN
jgi:hypothetical protein